MEHNMVILSSYSGLIIVTQYHCCKVVYAA